MEKEKIGLIEAISMAVGVMIGASIFSIFGLGVKLAGNGIIISFIISGILSLIVAYSYVKLGTKIKSNAGPLAFIHFGLKNEIITGYFSILLLLSYIITISLFAKGFTNYFIPLLGLPQNQITKELISSGIIIFFGILNILGSKIVGESESIIVFFKVSILLIFIIFGLPNIQIERIIPNIDINSIQGIIFAGCIFFLSYMGFGIITNIVENMKNPEKNVSRAIYGSIFFVLLIYIGITLVVIGSLPLDQIIKHNENALAVAAEPFLGKLGFLLISIGALLSTSSAMNATIFGSANLAYSLAKEGELPKFFERKLWFGSSEGLYITIILSIIFTLFFDLSSISSMICLIFVMLYIFVILSHIKLIDKVGGNKYILFFNVIILSIVFSVLMYYQAITSIGSFISFIILLFSIILIEILYSEIRNGFKF